MDYNYIMELFTAICHNSLPLRLTPLSIRELFFLQKIPCNIYGLDEGLFTIVLKEKAVMNKDTLKDLVFKKQVTLFAKKDEYKKIIESHQNNLRNVSRSLSIGDPLVNCKKHMNLLTINLQYLLANPIDDDLLNLQFQSVTNLSAFLMNNIGLHKSIYEEYLKQKHYYVFAQPLISSLFLLGVLKQSLVISNKEIESLFLTSYFKDVGMSTIPISVYDKKDLSEAEKEILMKHPATSIKILSGRVSIGTPYLKIIEQHHSISLLESEQAGPPPKNPPLLRGFETMMVLVMDLISAMISDRPYRKKTTLFDALELVKSHISDKYPQEFRLMVVYFKQFFN